MTKKAIIFILFSFLTSCSEVLVTDLTERDANKALSVLLENNIYASKGFNESGVFFIKTHKKSFAAAVHLLENNGIPKEEYKSIDEMFPAKGALSPTQEWLKYNHSLSQQLASTISDLPGVISANVHIAQAQKGGPFDDPLAPSAAVMVQMKEEAIEETMVAKVKQLVSFAVKDLEYEKVNVLFISIPPVKIEKNLVSLLGVIVHNDSVGIVKVYLIGFLTLMCALILFLVYMVRINKSISRK